MAAKPLSLGFSPCPNDTFIFYALVHGQAGIDGHELGRELLADVETLNSWAMTAWLDISKLSFHALGHVIDDYVLLGAGAALGRGCGPLLVAGRKIDRDGLAAKKLAIPGRYTTAAMLLKMAVPGCKNLVEMRFDKIMPAIKSGELDAGVIIHESRFTYRQQGLVMVMDLGAWWEEVSGCPLPLGCIAARRRLGEELLIGIDGAVGRSVRWALDNPESCRDYVRRHAQELDDRVVSAHIGLYVNRFTEGLGEEGLAAVRSFMEMGRRSGVLPGKKGRMQTTAAGRLTDLE